MSEEQKKSRRRRRRPRSSSRNKARSSAKKSSNASSGNRKSASSGASKKAKSGDTQGGLTIQRHTEKSISPINKDIFIYTYTLRPRSLLDSYQAGPNIAEKMKFEQPDKPPLGN